MIQQTIDLDVIPGKQTPIIHVNQGDTGQNRLMFNLLKNGSPISYPGSAIIQGTTPEGSFSHSGSILGNRVLTDLQADMTGKSGDVVAQLVLTDTGERVGTQNFIIRVQEQA